MRKEIIRTFPHAHHSALYISYRPNSGRASGKDIVDFPIIALWITVRY